jgi:hypothetical protein
MRITRLKIQGFRSINRGFDCTLQNLAIFVGRNNAGKSCAVRALDLFFNKSELPTAFEPHIRINPGSARKKRFSIIIGIWLSNLPTSLKSKYRPYLNTDGELPIRLYYSPKDSSIEYSCFRKGVFSTTKTKGEVQGAIIEDVSAHILVRVIPETRDLAREFQTELGHGFKALKETVLVGAEGRFSKEAKAYKGVVETLISSSLVNRINANMGNVIPDHEISIGNIENSSFSRLVLNSLIDSLPIFAISGDSTEILIDQMGAGFQSSVLVALYRTVAQLEGKKLILCVEEPEIHLDSHSQRYCYHHWSEEIARENDLNQVLITSHSAFLVNEASPDQLVLVRRDEQGCTTTSQLTKAFLANNDLVKLSTKTLGLHNTDLFFSSFILLVEGEGDTVAFKGFMEKLLREKKSKYSNLSLTGVAIIDCGGKDGIRALADLVDELLIPKAIVFDRDVIQETDAVNKWTHGDAQVEKTYTGNLSRDWKNLTNQFGSEAALSKASVKIAGSISAGKQLSFPRKLNEILAEHNIFVMRTEHETDVIDTKNMQIVAAQFGCNLADYERNLISLADVLIELKAKNKKSLKKAFETAKLVASTDDWSQVPNGYALLCNRIYRLIGEYGIQL